MNWNRLSLLFFLSHFRNLPYPLPMHCWAGLTSQWLYSSAVGAGNFEKSWSDNDFSLCIVPTPPIWRPTAPHHSSPLPHCFAINTRFFCARPNMYDHWIAFNCIKFPSVPSKLIILQNYDIHCSTELASCFVRISKSLIAIVSWWVLDFIDLLHFYRSQPLMGRRHLRVNQQGRLVVESFCRRCRFECHGAQWCGLAGSSRISRLQAWCCAFRRSSVARRGLNLGLYALDRM